MAQPIQQTGDQFNELLVRLNAGNNGNNIDPSKAIKPERPTFDVDTTEGEWSVFEDNWNRFKRMAKLTAIDNIRDNLRQCCAPQLNKRLFDVKGTASLNAV